MCFFNEMMHRFDLVTGHRSPVTCVASGDGSPTSYLFFYSFLNSCFIDEDNASCCEGNIQGATWCFRNECFDIDMWLLILQFGLPSIQSQLQVLKPIVLALLAWALGPILSIGFGGCHLHCSLPNVHRWMRLSRPILYAYFWFQESSRKIKIKKIIFS